VAGTTGSDHTGLSLRLGARRAQASLLRAHLRLWLAEQHTAGEEVLDILLAANEAFTNALVHARQPRSIAIHVDARLSEDVVEIVVRDHGRWREGNSATAGAGVGLGLMHALMDTVEVQTNQEGTVVRLRRVLGRHPNPIAGVATVPDRDRLELLSGSSIFASQPAAMLERLSGQLIPFTAAADQTIIHEGDYGDLFYLIAKGEVDISVKSRHVATLGAGDHVGEIALLRHVPRTATVVAGTPIQLYALTQDDVLTSVTSDQASRRTAETLITTRLTELEAILGRTA
jgi:anti-sigma regulatory factor (Ser/Thr protein kinase)